MKLEVGCVRKSLIDGVFAFCCGLIACLVWWAVFMFAFGAVGATAAAVYVIGIPIAACASFLLGTSRGPNADIPAICVGWVLSLAITPATAILVNPVDNNLASKLGAALILASVSGIGIFGVAAGIHHSRATAPKWVVSLSIVAAVVTGLLLFGIMRWMW